MVSYDVSPDGKQVVYTTVGSDGKSELWSRQSTEASPPGSSVITGKQRRTSVREDRFCFGW